MDVIRLLIADDHALIREGLTRVLGLDPAVTVIGEAADGLKAVEMVRRLVPDVVLMDLHMPQMGGLEAARMIKAEFPHIRVIALTVDDREKSVLEVFCAGVSGYVLKDIAPEALVSTIRAVFAGETVMDQRISRMFFNELSGILPSAETAAGVSAGHAPLTPREEEILCLIAGGAHNRDIADKLFISEKTVKNHITSIFRKLGVEDRTRAALFAIKIKWCPWHRTFGPPAAYTGSRIKGCEVGDCGHGDTSDNLLAGTAGLPVDSKISGAAEMAERRAPAGEQPDIDGQGPAGND